MHLVALLFAALAGLTAQDAAADRARSTYEAAMRATDPQQRVALLRASFDTRQSFEASIAIADALVAQRSSPQEIRMWSERAYRLAQPGEPRARALFRLAETYAATNQPTEYRAVLKRSIEEFPTPEAERALLEASRPSMKTANEIVRSWRVGTERSMRDLVIEPTVDLAINFAFDSAVIDSSSERQLMELANAIGLVAVGQPAASAPRLLVIGHTDTVGTEEYNLQLSRRRAESVRTWLVKRYGLSGANLETEGRGMREPLVRGSTPQHHAVNRRVEVRLLP